MLENCCSFINSWGNPLVNFSEVIGSPLVNLLQSVKGYWKPSEKFDERSQRVSANLKQIPQSVLATFSNGRYLLQGCQYPLITYQKVLITLWKLEEVIGESQRHLQEGYTINRQRENTFTIPLKNLKTKL